VRFPLLAAPGTVPEEPLLSPVTQIGERLHALADGLGVDREPEHRGVRRPLAVDRSAEQPVDGLAGGLPAEVPQRDVDGADGVHRLALPAVALAPVEQVPELLRRPGVPTGDKPLQVGGVAGDPLAHRSRQPLDACVGLDEQERALDGEWCLRVVGVVLGGRLGSELLVAIDGAAQTLLPERSGGLVEVARERLEPESGYLHDTASRLPET